MKIFKSFLIVFFALSSAAGLYGCEAKKYNWNEEVLLNDKTILLAHRTVSFKYSQPIGGGGGGAYIENSTLRFDLAENISIWNGGQLLPILLDKDKDTQEWFIVATFIMCDTWVELGRPPLPYVEFRYRSNKWVRVPLSSHLLGTKTNLIIPTEARASANQTVSTKAKIEQESNPSPRFKSIVASWDRNC